MNRFEINGQSVQVFDLQVCNDIDHITGQKLKGLVSDFLMRKPARISVKNFQPFVYQFLNTGYFTEDEIKELGKAL